MDIGPGSLAQVGNLVDEGNFHGEKRVRGVFDHLRRGEIRHHERGLDEIERAIQVLHDGDRLGAVGADHDPIGPKKILDRRPFSKELRVGHDVELVGGGLMVFDDLAQAFPCPHRHGGLGHDDLVAGHVLTNAPADFFDERQISGTVAAGRRSHRDKNDEGPLNRLGHIGGEGQTLLMDSLGD